MIFVAGLPGKGAVLASNLKLLDKALAESWARVKGEKPPSRLFEACKPDPYPNPSTVLVTAQIPGTELTLQANLRTIISALAEAWATELRVNPLPPIYESGVQYRPEPASNPCEEFADPYTCRERGWGDCDDLVLWRIAEIIAAGKEAWPQAMRKVGTTRYHVAVRKWDGSTEDPSLILYPRRKS